MRRWRALAADDAHHAGAAHALVDLVHAAERSASTRALV
jgi:hypothetical protein